MGKSNPAFDPAETKRNYIELTLDEFRKQGAENGYNFDKPVAVRWENFNRWSADPDDFRHDCVSRIILPEKVAYLPRMGFFEDLPVQSINVPSNVKGIPMSGFKGAHQLSDVRLSEGLTSIGSHAFEDCGSLRNIQLPNSLKEIGSRAFEGTSLESLYIPAGVETLSGQTFIGIENAKIELSPDNPYFKMENDAIYSSDGKVLVWHSPALQEKNFAVPEGVVRIENGAFANCKTLESITLPSTLKTIGNGAFENCTSLKELDLPESLVTIRSNAFKNCASLTELELGSNVRKIGVLVFDGSAVTSIRMPIDMESIGTRAFANTPLKTLTLDGDFTSWYSKMELARALQDAKKLEAINCKQSPPLMLDILSIKKPTEVTINGLTEDQQEQWVRQELAPDKVGSNPTQMAEQESVPSQPAIVQYPEGQDPLESSPDTHGDHEPVIIEYAPGEDPLENDYKEYDAEEKDEFRTKGLDNNDLDR